MRSAPIAIAWEVWARRRAGFVALAAAVPAFAGLLRWVSARPGVSDDLKLMLLYTSMGMAIAAMFGLVNFTQEEGFPRRLFVRPVRTWVLVTCPMAYGVAGVVGLYVLWAAANGGRVLGFVAVLLGVGVVSFQVIVWVLARHRLARLAALAGLGVELVTVASLPTVYGRASDWPVEQLVWWGLAGQAVVAYGWAMWHVGRERTGGGGGWWRLDGGESRVGFEPMLRDAGRERRPAQPALQVVKYRNWSVGRALEWVEWRRGGLMLPVGVALGAMAVLAVSWLGGKGSWGEEATGLVLPWLAGLPVVMGAIAGVACGRPDAWSMDGRVPPILAMRPVTCGQIVGAKMRVAAWGTVMAWVALLAIGGAWMMWGAHRETLRQVWGLVGIVWGEERRFGLVAMAAVCAAGTTWSLTVSAMWAGLSRRSWPVVVWMGAGLAGVIGLIVMGVLYDNGRQGPVLWCVGVMPWVLGGLVAGKMWLAAWTLGAARRRGLVSGRFVAACVGVWVAGTVCFAGWAWALSPAVAWVRELVVLGGALVVPLARLGAAPLALAGNRHR